MTSKSFSESLFWDCNLNYEDYSRYKSLIVDRVIHRGTLEDWQLMKSLFGTAIIKNELLKLKYINPKILRGMSTLFDTPITEFRSYRTGGLHWWER